MENILITGKITATSKKQDGDYKQEIPTKTAYVSTDEEMARKLEDFGLTKYTPKDGGDPYFILKFPANLRVYTPGDDVGVKRPDLSQITVDGVETNNFKTPDNKKIWMSVFKGNHKNNDFYRLQAIFVQSPEDIEEIKPENPFADLDDLPF